MRKLSVILIGFIWAGMLMADVVALKPGVPERYVVKKGDTLWDISNMFLDDPWRWPDIWHLNPQIKNPHLIYPGDVIGLVKVNGETKITTVQRSDTSRTVKVTPEPTTPEPMTTTQEPGVVKLDPTVRATPIFGAIPAIPREYVEGFLTGNRIVTKEEIDASPYVIGGYEGRIILGAGDIIYARGNFGDGPLPAYEIFRPGKPYVDPETEEFLGYEVESLGLVENESYSGDIATMQILRSSENIRIGDRLLNTTNDSLVGTYVPSAPDEQVNGFILSVLRGVSAIGQYDVVAINLGKREGMQEGNILNIFRRGDLVKDPVNNELVRLPSEQAGLLMVFKTFEKLSYGLVLEANRPMSVGDELRSPG